MKRGTFGSERAGTRRTRTTMAPPTMWREEPCAMGIDEAGRGPVLGSMVYACAFCPIAYLDTLRNQAYADSKTLSMEERESLFEAMKEDANLAWRVDVICAKDLSGKMLRAEKCNLNTISHQSAMGLVQGALDEGFCIQELYVDTVGDPDRYRDKLSERFPNIQITVKPKADSLFPIVSAASIAAKVTRDNELKNWAFEESAQFDREFGSGYPSDPATKRWLAANCHRVFGFPSLIRFSWQTCTRILEDRGVRVAWECEEEEDLGPKQRKISFNAPEGVEASKDAEGGHQRRPPFFKSRRIDRIVGSF